MRISPGVPTAFDYETAFSRNIGWITEWEQQQLRNKTVAIAGLGGVGGAHAVTLARLGIGGFHFADLDRFDVVNLNCQRGAFISTVNLEKTAVIAQMTQDINPGARLKIFPRGGHPDATEAQIASHTKPKKLEGHPTRILLRSFSALGLLTLNNDGKYQKMNWGLQSGS